MSARTPPYPRKDLEAWARDLYNYMISEANVKERLEPSAVLLAHRVAGVLERASVDGILLYDPAVSVEAPVVSIGGEFVPLALVRQKTSFGVQTATHTITPSALQKPAFNFSPNGRLTVGVGMFRVFASVNVTGVNRNNFTASIVFVTAAGTFYADEVTEFTLDAPLVGFRATYAGILVVTTPGTIRPSVLVSGGVNAVVGVNSYFSCEPFLPVVTVRTPDWS